MATIFFYGPKLDKEKSKEMIKSFTEASSRLTGIEKPAFVVYLRESSPQNVWRWRGTVRRQIKEK